MTHKHKAEFECNHCNTFFRTRMDLNRHSKEIHKQRFKHCRNYPINNCEYDSDCNFYHIVLNQDEHICFKCGDVFTSKTNLVNPIKSVHVQETWKRFQDNKYSFGEKRFFLHINKIVAPNAKIVGTPLPGSPRWNTDFPAKLTMGQSPVVGLTQQMKMILQQNIARIAKSCTENISSVVKF